MLVGNGVRAGGNPQRWLFGAGALNVNRPQWAQRGARYNFQAGYATVIGGAGIAGKAAFPNGYLPPAAWQLPVEPGGIGATGGQLAGDAELAASLAGGLNATADLTGSATLEATGSLIVQAAADLIGIPWQILVGPKGLAEGKLEVKRRSDGSRENLSPAEVVAKIAR